MMVGSTTIGIEHTNVQLLMVHWVMVENELLQFKSIRELMKKSSFLRYSRGAVKEEVLGIKATIGAEQSKRNMLRAPMPSPKYTSVRDARILIDQCGARFHGCQET